MNRLMFLVGAGIGYVLGARAGRERYEQIVDLAERAAHSAPAKKAGELAQEGLDELSHGIAKLTGELQAQSKDLAPRLVHTAESLQKDLARRAAELGERLDHAVERTGEQLQRNRELLDGAVESTRERIDGAVESTRERIDGAVGSTRERIDATVESTRERIDGVTERSRERQLHDVYSVSDLRDEMLDDLATEHDEMIDADSSDRGASE